MQNLLEVAVEHAVADLHRLARRKRTVYGGSDFSPVDYDVSMASPSEIYDVATRLEKALRLYTEKYK